MYTIFEQIDKLYHEFKPKMRPNSIFSNLIDAAPVEHRTVKLFPTSAWKKAVRKYVDELDKVENWNKMSLEFNKQNNVEL